MAVKIIVGDALKEVPKLAPGSVDCVITDPVWPGAPDSMFPECNDPHGLLADTLMGLPTGVKRVVIIMRSDQDPRFLTAVPAKWPFFGIKWMYYALPGYYGRRLGGSEVAYCFGDPIKFAPGRQVIPSMCEYKAQSTKKNGHPCPRHIDHMRWLVKWWSDPGETILDPFCGSGTIVLAAKNHGRDAIGIEINPEYAEMARQRIRDDAPLFAVVD